MIFSIKFSLTEQSAHNIFTYENVYIIRKLNFEVLAGSYFFLNCSSISQKLVKLTELIFFTNHLRLSFSLHLKKIFHQFSTYRFNKKNKGALLLLIFLKLTFLHSDVLLLLRYKVKYLNLIPSRIK